MSVNKTISKQGLLFCLIGAAAAAVHFCCLFILVHFIKLSPESANPIAFLFAFIISFCGHFQFTFRKSRQKWLSSLWRWFFSSIVGFGLNQLLFMLGLIWCGDQAYWWLWFIVTVLVTGITFILGKFWAFRAKGEYETSHD